MTLALVGLLQPLSVLCWATFATITFPARIASGRGLRLVNRYRFLFHRFKPSCASAIVGKKQWVQVSVAFLSAGICVFFLQIVFLSSLPYFSKNCYHYYHHYIIFIIGDFGGGLEPPPLGKNRWAIRS